MLSLGASQVEPVVKNPPAKAEDAGSIPGSHLYMTPGKTIALTIWTLLIN